MPGESLLSSDLTVIRPHTPLRDQVVDRLRDAIIIGHFAPGSRLIERQMCEQLGVSRTLVREALRQLESEGWVRLLPYRGPVVATMTGDEIRQLYEVRSALEGLAAQLCAERGSEALFDQMEQVVNAIAAGHLRRDRDEQRLQAGQFYTLLREGAGNELLHKQLSAFSARVTWLRAVAFSLPERASATAQEERNLLAALRARDGVRSRALCEGHLMAAVGILIKTLAPEPRKAPRRQSAAIVDR